MEKLTFGGLPSERDYRTVVTDKSGPVPYLNLKINLDKPSTDELCSQKQLGICTACGVRMAEQHFDDGIRLSEYWLYLMGKVFYDKDLYEGSSILTMLKVAKNYGIPDKGAEEYSKLKTDGTYKEFIDDFNQVYGGKIPAYILWNAQNHKIPGYYSVPVLPISIAREISNGNVLIFRLAVGENTYTAPDGRISWDKRDILPLRAPKFIEGGHIMVINEYTGLGENQVISGPNSWSRAWGDIGYFSFIYDTQKPFFTEAWAISDIPVVVDKLPLFTKDLYLGITHKEVKTLQKFLNKYGSPVASSGPGSLGFETDYFGRLTLMAVIKFQQDNNIFPSAGYFGVKSRTLANKIILANE